MQVAVLGLGTFGSRVAEVLTQKGVEVLAVDSDPARVDALKDRVAQAVIIDATDEKALRRTGIGDVDVAVVALGANIEANILMTAVLRRLGVGRIIARGDTEVQAEILREVGASRVLLVEHQMAAQLAEELAAPYVLSRRILETGHTLGEVKAPAWMAGRSLIQLDVRRRFGISVIAIKRRRPGVARDGTSCWEMELVDGPSGDTLVLEDDVLLVIGMDAGIRRMIEEREGAR